MVATWRAQRLDVKIAYKCWNLWSSWGLTLFGPSSRLEIPAFSRKLELIHLCCHIEVWGPWLGRSNIGRRYYFLHVKTFREVIRFTWIGLIRWRLVRSGMELGRLSHGLHIDTNMLIKIQNQLLVEAFFFISSMLYIISLYILLWSLKSLQTLHWIEITQQR